MLQGGAWQYELKLDGFRAVAYKTGCRIHLRSKRLSTAAPSPPNHTTPDIAA